LCPIEEGLPGIDVLNISYGDFELRFDPNKPDEVHVELCHMEPKAEVEPATT